MRALVTVLGLVVAVAPARAQSKRYPPEPVDKDAEQTAKSSLWSAAITPERHPYQDLVRSASDLLLLRGEPTTLEAIAKLDAAVQLLPREPEAYRLRAEAYLELHSWARCAHDFAAADAYLRRDDEPAKTTAERRRKLGICQARAGTLGDAETTLADTAASGNGSAEVWLRLGEVRIAMGKLDEAISALRSALDNTEQPAQATIRFMLAAAYDRARRPADALLEAGEGVKLDRQLTTLQSPVVPPINPGEVDYMLALAYRAVDPPRPEFVLALFRRFVKAAPDSPWRKRAEEHIRDLKTNELPEAVAHEGTAQLDAEATRTVVRRAMPQMRACLARYPATVVAIEVTRAGPRTPASDRQRPRITTPSDSVLVRRAIGEPTDAELDALDRCLQPLAIRIALPAVKERDTFYKATFHVVGP